MPPQPSLPPRSNPHIRAIFTVLFIIFVCIGSYILYRAYEDRGEKQPVVYATFGPTPIGEALMLNEDRFIAVPSPDPKLQVVEVLPLGDRTIYLLGDSASLTTNIYEVGTDGALSAITDSPSIKFGVRFDASSGQFVYLASKITASTLEGFRDAMWQLTVFTEATHTEREVAAVAGIPLQFHDGIAYLAVGGDLVAVTTANGASRPIITIEPGAPVAISPDGREIVAYHSSSQTLLFYSLASGAPSFEREEPVTVAPAGLFYTNDKLWVLGQSSLDPEGRIQHLTLGMFDSKQYRTIESPYAFSMLRKIDSAYDH